MPFINHSKKFIFVANARCASTSMYLELENQSQFDNYTWPGDPEGNPNYQRLGALPYLYHMSISDVTKTYPEYKNYFKFAFIRNPWCRFVSAYHEFQKPGHEVWAEELGKFLSFRDFCFAFTDTSLASDIHFLPLSNQITVDGEIALDFVGRFENLNEDYAHLANLFNFMPSLSFHERSTNTYKYRDYYDRDTEKIIYNYYESDIELFKYSF